MTKPTEGPWTHYDDSESPVHRHVIAAIGKTIAHVYCTKGHEAEDAANARLLAKSWEMRRVLQKIIDGLPQNRDWLDPMLEQEARDLLIDGDSQ